MSFNTHQKSTKPPTTLNPHAAEFVPFTLRSPSLPESSSSAASRHPDEEEEARQFWNHQLPDDITRDFNLMTQDNDYDDSGSFSLASLSLDEAEKFPCASQGRGRFMFSDQPGEHNANGNGEMEVGPVDFLASQFPGFASESLAQVYFANGCDLHSTLEMLTQLEVLFSYSINHLVVCCYHLFHTSDPFAVATSGWWWIESEEEPKEFCCS